MFAKIFVFALAATVASCVQIVVKNVYDVPIWIQATGLQDGFILNPGKNETIEQDAGWVGRVWAEPEECQNSKCHDLPATLTEFNIVDNDSQYYDVSLIDGFDMVVKVIPTGTAPDSTCSAVMCQANLTKLCPEENQVKNSKGVVVSCRNTPDLFQKYCPLAISEATDERVFKCQAKGYLIVYG